jgi:hypothetical protein
MGPLAQRVITRFLVRLAASHLPESSESVCKGHEAVCPHDVDGAAEREQIVERVSERFMASRSGMT